MSFYQYDHYGGDEYWDTSYDEVYDFEDHSNYFDDPDDYWYYAEQYQDYHGYDDDQNHFGEGGHGLYAGDHEQHMGDFDDSYEQYHMSSQHHEGGDHLTYGMGDHHGNYHEHMPQQWHRSDSSGQSDRAVLASTFTQNEVHDTERSNSPMTLRRASSTRSILSRVGQKLKINAPRPPSILVTQSPGSNLQSPISATPSPSSAKELFHSTMWRRSPTSIHRIRSMPTSPINNIPRSHPTNLVAAIPNEHSRASWQLDRRSPSPTIGPSNILDATQNIGPGLIGNFGFLAPRTP